LTVGINASYSLTFIVLGVLAALSTSAHADVLTERDQNITSDVKATHEKRLGAGIDPAHFVSWEACIAAAELERSDRDLKFFLSASNLSDSKAWFVGHSHANEARFCSEVLICEQAFGNVYSDLRSSYPPC
jgi:hypothetical protein